MSRRTASLLVLCAGLFVTFAVMGKAAPTTSRTDKPRVGDGRYLLTPLPVRTVGQKMPRSTADGFARSMMEVIEVLHEEHLNPVNAGDLAVWAIEELYRHAGVKIPDSVVLRSVGVRKMTNAQLRTLLSDARLALGKRNDLDDRALLDATLRRLLRRHDPESIYTAPEDIRRGGCCGFPFEGIGVRLGKDILTGHLLILTPIRNGPAHKACLYAGDRITTITRKVDEIGQPFPWPEKTPTWNLPLTEATSLLKGKEETSVTLTVERPGRDRPFDVTLERQRVEEESVLGTRRKKNHHWEYVIDRKNKIGYVRILDFARNTTRDLKRVMADLMKQGLKGFVLDLRFNPGGLLTASIDITDLFIDDGRIVRVQARDPDRFIDFAGQREGSLLGFPMVCLINGSSIMASELVAAALQDHKRAFVIGERSLGRARVQNVREVDMVDPKTGEEAKGELQFTTADFRRPSGATLHKRSTPGRESDKWGVVPDKVVKLTAREQAGLAEHLLKLERIEDPDRRSKPSFEDRQLAAALDYLRARLERK
jgi:carboxyl-terminal processing protease